MQKKTGYIPREVFFNNNNEEIIKDVIINTEKTIQSFRSFKFY